VNGEQRESGGREEMKCFEGEIQNSIKTSRSVRQKCFVKWRAIARCRPAAAMGAHYSFDPDVPTTFVALDSTAKRTLEITLQITLAGAAARALDANGFGRTHRPIPWPHERSPSLSAG
jgi:hypothetical protein